MTKPMLGPHHKCPYCKGTGEIFFPALTLESIKRRFDHSWLPDSESDCWIWTKNLNRRGYGTMSVGSKKVGNNGPRLAHRIAYELYRGPIPDGLALDHLCRNRHCVNPDHLEAVTLQENTARGNTFRASIRTHCPHGHPYSGYNLVVRDDGARTCRKCQRVAVKKYAVKKYQQLQKERLL